MAKNSESEPTKSGERIAKVIARSGACSRRDAEKLIAEARVAVNGEPITSPALNVGTDALITIDGKPIAQAQPTRLWRYHKPAGLVTTHRDPEGRPTVFSRLPPSMPRIISIGRLDINSEGLLLLTNDGELARRLELPSQGWVRRYRVRLFGSVTQAQLDRLAKGVVVDGVRYQPVKAELERAKGPYAWAMVTLHEGKEPRDQKADGASRAEGRTTHPGELWAFSSGTFAGRRCRRNPRESVARTIGPDEKIKTFSPRLRERREPPRGASDSELKSLGVFTDKDG